MAFNYSSGRVTLSTSVNRVTVPKIYCGGNRDSYIGFSHGGNTINYEPSTKGCNLLSSKVLGNGSLYVGKDQCGGRKDLWPVNGNRKITYLAKGSGRDGYISVNSGGMYPEKTVAQYKQNFVD